MGLALSARRAPRRFEAHGRPEARAAFEKQRTFRSPAPRGDRAQGDGAGSSGADVIVSGKRPTSPLGGAGPALPVLWNLTSGPVAGFYLRQTSSKMHPCSLESHSDVFQPPGARRGAAQTEPSNQHG